MTDKNKINVIGHAEILLPYVFNLLTEYPCNCVLSCVNVLPHAFRFVYQKYARQNCLYVIITELGIPRTEIGDV